MRELAPGLWRLDGLIPKVINVFLVATPDGDVLIDAGTRWAAGSILRQLRGRRLAGVALTHAHPDHQGSAREVCTRCRVPLACHEADVDVMEGRRRMGPRTPPVILFDRIWSGPPHPVARRWKGGETLGDWRGGHA